MSRDTTTIQTTGMFAPRRLAHFNVEVQEVLESTDFYRDLIGFDVAYERPLINSVFFSNQNTYHDLAIMDQAGGMGSNNGPRLHHLAYELENEVALVDGYRRALEAGVTFLATQSHDVAHSVYLKDPDGNGIEIYADVIAEWQTVSTGVITKAKESWAPGDTPPLEQACYPVDPEITVVPDAVFHARATTNACLLTQDVGRLVEFYRTVIGLSPMVDTIDGDFVLLAGSLGTHSLTIAKAQSETQVGLAHVSIEALDRDGLEAGVTTYEESSGKPTAVHVLEDRMTVELIDPDGFRLHLYAGTQPSLGALIECGLAEALHFI